MGPIGKNSADAATFGLALDRDADTPLFRQIAEQLRDAVRNGRLSLGTRLPPERLLARALGVNRTTVLAAYNELKREGLLAGHVGRGTEVVSSGRGTDAGAVAWNDILRPAHSFDPLIRDLLSATDPDVVSLALGMPAADLLPVDDLARLHADVFGEVGAPALMYSPTEGLPELREALAGRLHARGIRVSAHEVLVTSGSQQALDLIVRELVSPGDTVVTEEPTYVGMLQTLRAAGARIVTVPVDDEGMQVERLESLLARHQPRLVYTLPTFQNPSGAVMSLARRRRLLDLAARYQVPVVEDDPYGVLSFDGAPPAPLKALDAHGVVFHVSTSSKTFCPGLRLGWLVAPPAVVRQLALARQVADLHPATPGQHVLARAIDEGLLDRHVERMTKAYARRRDALLDALAPTEELGLDWVRPEGGIFTWSRLPAGTSMARLLAEAARERVAFLPGGVCSADGSSSAALRLNFSAHPEDRLREGARRLGRSLANAARMGPIVPVGMDTGLRPII